MADESQPRQPAGDEAELFRDYNDELLRSVRRAADTSPEVVEDACAFAWAKFLRYQPDRDRNWRGWLLRVRAARGVGARSSEARGRAFPRHLGE